LPTKPKKQGLPFAGHVPDSISVEEASSAGQKSIEHLTGVLSACSSHDIYDPVKAAAVFAAFKTNHTWQCPTLTVLRLSASDPSITNDDRVKYMPPDLRLYWNGRRDSWAKKSPAEIAARKKYFQRQLEIVGVMQRAGVDILAGTDTENPYCFPGFSLHDELGWLVQAGLSPMEALQAATRNAARFMGRENELGTVQQGKLADLILLEANPLNDIVNTRKIAAVVYGGRLFPKSSLDKMLAKVEALAARKTVVQMLLETYSAKGVDAMIQRYRELQSAKTPPTEISEDDLNTVGYELMGRKRIKDAIKILELNAVAYPQSSNVYDSLGESYVEDGDKKLAIENFERSLKLDPKNRNAIEKLKQLKAAGGTGL
jgi:tetratricopeptide (TPR) repeat protein